jgi:NAD+ synthase (glutamine-hydrolysing)
MAAVVGFPEAQRDLTNAAAVCAHGSVQGVYRKHVLPNYAVFDEQRYFAPGADAPELVRIAGVRTGISICEDAWSPDGPIADQAAGGAELILNLAMGGGWPGEIDDSVLPQALEIDYVRAYRY